MQEHRPNIDEILKGIPDKTPKGILKWCLNQRRNGKDEDTLKSIFSSIITLINNPLLPTEHADAFDDVTFMNFVNLTINSLPDDEIQIQEPDENQQDNIEVNIPEGESPTPEQDEQKKKKDGYDKRRNRDNFFAALMEDILKEEINRIKLKMIPLANARQDENGKEQSIFTKMRLNSAIDQITGFQDYCEKLRKETKTPVDKNTAEARYIFKAEVLLYNLMNDPKSEKHYKALMDFSKKLSGTLNVKHIILGIVLLAIGLTLIGVTCGIAAGAIIIPGLVIGTWLGVGVISVGLSLGLGSSWVGLKGSKIIPKIANKFNKGVPSNNEGGIIKNAPFFNRDLSYRVAAAAKAVKKESDAVDARLDMDYDDIYGHEDDKKDKDTPTSIPLDSKDDVIDAGAPDLN